MESSLRCWTHLFIISRPYFQQLLLQCRKNIRELKLESWTRSLIANQKCLLLRPTSLTPVTLYQSSFQQKNDTGIIKLVFKTKNRHIKYFRVEQIAQVNFTVGEQKEPTVYLLIMKFQVRDASTPQQPPHPFFFSFSAAGRLETYK